MTTGITGAELLSLAERVESAEGPDRELDALVERAFFPRRPWANPLITVPREQADYYEVPDGEYNGSTLHLVGLPLMKADHPQGDWARGPNGRSVVKNRNRHYPIRYTASIDAALTLVPEGWAVERSSWYSFDEETAYFELWQYRKGDHGAWWHGSSEMRAKAGAATPALALTAACLRARAALAEQS